MSDQVEGFQLQGNAPEVYEAAKVPGLFRPLAEMTLDRVSVRPSDRVLDVACGTGIVSRLVAQHLHAGASLTGVDLNGGMIAKAAALSVPGNISVVWQEADVADMPFDDAVFDLALCQQGLQFFPDKPAALSEMRRVLAPGGRLALTVWCSVSDYIAALSASLAAHVSEKAASQAQAPFSFDDADEIRGLVAGAGFMDVEVTAFDVPRRLGPGTDAIAMDMAGTPYASELAAAAEDVVAEIVADVASAIASYAEGSKDAPLYTVPQRTHLVQAVVPA